MKRFVLAAMVALTALVMVGPGQAHASGGYRKPVAVQHRVSRTTKRRATGNVVWVPMHGTAYATATAQHWDTDARVLVGWSHRGGTCNIEYTEAGSKMYNYRTSSACDEVHTWVGQLVHGRTYKFRVTQDDWNFTGGRGVARAL